MIANHTRHDPPPTITLMESGDTVTYQWRGVDPKERRHYYVTDQVEQPNVVKRGKDGDGKPLTYRDYRIRPGDPDRDRLICYTGMHPDKIGDPIVYVPDDPNVDVEMRIGYGSTAGPDLDRHNGCPFVTQSIYGYDPNKWVSGHSRPLFHSARG